MRGGKISVLDVALLLSFGISSLVMLLTCWKSLGIGTLKRDEPILHAREFEVISVSCLIT